MSGGFIKVKCFGEKNTFQMQCVNNYLVKIAQGAFEFPVFCLNERHSQLLCQFIVFVDFLGIGMTMHFVSNTF